MDLVLTANMNNLWTETKRKLLTSLILCVYVYGNFYLGFPSWLLYQAWNDEKLGQSAPIGAWRRNFPQFYEKLHQTDRPPDQWWLVSFTSKKPKMIISWQNDDLFRCFLLDCFASHCNRRVQKKSTSLKILTHSAEVETKNEIVGRKI